MIHFLRSRWIAVLVTVVVVAGGGVLFFGGTADADDSSLVAHVVRGDFKVVVTTAGELRARSAVEIRPPQNADRVGAYQMKISTIKPEGTLVKEGEVVAELDKSPLMTSLNNFNLAMQKAQAVFDQAQLDTTLNLSKAREDLRIAGSALEERKIAKEQAMYEAPSIKRQADIDYDKADRALQQGTKDYVTRESQAKAKMREVSADVERNRIQLQLVQDVMENFTIKAPAPGMLIYAKDYSGKKKVVGSMISSWEPAVATLPDLTKMESTTYINEVDVRKIALGQSVSLTLDSDPAKRLTGKVTYLANVGEERPNSDAKVFEVRIEVAESDTTLRPGMTTGNGIEVMSVRNVLSIPLEAVTTEGNVPYVFKRKGGSVTKQEVETGAINDTHVVISQGIDENDVVLLVPPANHASLASVRLENRTRTAPAESDAPASKSVPVKPPPKDSSAGAATKPATPPGKPTTPVKPSTPDKSSGNQ